MYADAKRVFGKSPIFFPAISLINILLNQMKCRSSILAALTESQRRVRQRTEISSRLSVTGQGSAAEIAFCAR